MIPLSLQEIADAVGGPLVGADDATLRPAGVARVDSRDVAPGDVFVCVEGERVDGHDFAASARAAGAVLAIAQRTVDGPHVIVPDVIVALGTLARAALERRPAVAVVGLTGSSGKTSTKDLLAQVLEAAGPTVSPPGSFNNDLGLPLTVLRVDDDTRFLVLEMGARGVGHIRRLCELARPRVGMVLNVGSAHLGEFGDRAAIARAKGELVESLPAGGTAVLNADDPYVAAMAALTPAEVRTFGLDPDASVRAVDVELDPRGRPSFVLVSPEGVAPVDLQVVGAHQVPNALAAATAAIALGVPVATIAHALSEATPRSAWRMEVDTTPAGVTVVNDAYNANPESVRAAIDALEVLGAGRRTWAVLGTMRELGDASAGAHADIGRYAVEHGVDQVVAVGTDARAVVDGAREAGLPDASIHEVPDAEAALDLLCTQARADDVVLVKASRAVGLERVAAALLSTAPEGTSTAPEGTR